MAGDVETGYITKHKDELFAAEPIETEVYAQAALGLLMIELQKKNLLSAGPHGSTIGFAFNNERQFELIASSADTEPVTVLIKQTGRNKFDVSVKGASLEEETYLDVISESKGSSITTFFPHTRIETRLITQENKLTVFQHGKQIQLALATPNWQEKALGLKDVTNSVLAPMPCKILRTEVSEGDLVEKDQALVVIESMKMETVIRSPQKGVIAKMVHKQGVGHLPSRYANSSSFVNIVIGYLQSRDIVSSLRGIRVGWSSCRVCARQVVERNGTLSCPSAWLVVRSFPPTEQQNRPCLVGGIEDFGGRLLVKDCR